MDDLKKRLEQLLGNKTAPITETPENEEEESETIDTIFGPTARNRLMTPEPRIQPENRQEFERFQVGQLSTDFWGPYTLEHLSQGKPFDLKGCRMALPRPKWPEPGTPATPEIEAAHRREDDIFFNANQRMKDVLVFLKFNPDPEHPEWSEDSVQRAAENPKFLEGLWTARGFKIPTRDELLEMARQTTPAPEEIPAKPSHFLEHFENKPQWIPEWQQQRDGQLPEPHTS
jgi:hypothetical protein